MTAGPRFLGGALAPLLLVFAAAAGAQPAPAPSTARVSPLPAGPAVAPFRSAFDGYRRFEAGEPIADWRRSNDAMRALGGHPGHVSAPPPGDARAAQDGKGAVSQPAADPRK